VEGRVCERYCVTPSADRKARNERGRRRGRATERARAPAKRRSCVCARVCGVCVCGWVGGGVTHLLRRLRRCVADLQRPVVVLEAALRQVLHGRRRRRGGGLERRLEICYNC
jgi:hypothetical protein